MEESRNITLMALSKNCKILNNFSLADFVLSFTHIYCNYICETYIILL